MSRAVSARIWYDDAGQWQCYRLRVTEEKDGISTRWNDHHSWNVDLLFARANELTDGLSPRHADDGWTKADLDDWRWEASDDDAG